MIKRESKLASWEPEFLTIENALKNNSRMKLEQFRALIRFPPILFKDKLPQWTAKYKFHIEGDVIEFSTASLDDFLHGEISQYLINFIGLTPLLICTESISLIAACAMIPLISIALTISEGSLVAASIGDAIFWVLFLFILFLHIKYHKNQTINKEEQAKILRELAGRLGEMKQVEEK